MKDLVQSHQPTGHQKSIWVIIAHEPSHEFQKRSIKNDHALKPGRSSGSFSLADGHDSTPFGSGCIATQQQISATQSSQLRWS
eukprot:3629433-Amphidinium_carterae.2